MPCIHPFASALLGLSLAASAQTAQAASAQTAQAAQTASPTPSASGSPAEQLVATDRAIWQAIAGPRPNIPLVAQALAPDYIDMEAGIMHSRDAVLHDLLDVREFSFHYDHPRAVMLSPTSGYVIADLTFRTVANGAATTGRVLTTSVFTREGNRWISHLHTEQDLKLASTKP